MNNDSILHLSCTGLSMDDAISDMHMDEAGYDVPKQCYLCKRQEGGKPFTIRNVAEEEPSAVNIPLTLYQYERNRGKMIWYYRLCLECSTLLNLDLENE